jgi:hypothetical protein
VLFFTVICWEGTVQDAAYEERYCAYIDILGFADLMADLRSGNIKFEAIRDILKRIHKPYDPQIIDVEHCDFRAQSISDAVALSTRCTVPGLSMLFAAVRKLAEASLHEGYFLRGAICKGLLFHDDTTVFGEALVKAYRLESAIVKFPRIMLAKNVVSDALSSDLKKDFEQHIKQADDGPFYQHVLWHLQMLLDVLKERNYAPEGSEHQLTYYAKMRDTIQRRFDDSVDTPRHFEKVQWFANYWNISMREERAGLKFIKGPGLFQMRFLGT